MGFVVGNNNYSYLDKLILCEKDAELVDQTLRSLGFTTKLLLNQTNFQLRHELVEFGEKLVQGDLVFFYFSGHAGQQSSKNNYDNYIFGIDAAPEEEQHDGKILSGISFNNKILRWLDQDCMYLIILDACRTYPHSNIRYKSTYNAHVPVASQSALTMAPACLPIHVARREYDIIYACQPGYFAMEREDREYGYLAAALCENMSKPGTWADCVIETINKVQQQTNYRQNPSVQLNIGKKIYLTQNETPPELTTTSSNFSQPLDSASNLAQQMSALDLQDEELEQISIEQLEENFKVGGEIKNKFVEVRNQKENILFDVTKSSDKILVKNLKLVSINPIKCKFISIHVRGGQTIQFTNCDFVGIELYVGSQEYKRGLGTAILNSVHVENATNGVDFYNLNSVNINGLDVRNCRQFGCNIWDVKNVQMENVGIFQCKLFGVSIKMVDKFVASNVEVEDCRDGFNIVESCGVISDGVIRGCSCPVTLIKSQVEQRNVKKM